MTFTPEITIQALAVLIYLFARMFYVTYLGQQESYQVLGFRRHHLVKTFKGFEGAIWICAAISIVSVWLDLRILTWLVSALVGILGFFVYRAWHYQKQHMKKPLVWTARVKRLVTVYWVLSAVEGVLLAFTGMVLICAALATVNLWLALMVTKPIEWTVQQGYKRKASGRLNQLRHLNNLRVVGITGSYGKTSTKFILGTILSAKYEVLVTPSSFNTPMGICKVVNGDLASDHDVFVAEMGARHKGDIKELVHMVKPMFSIITAVGPAHLETFGSLENIARTKFDLARGTHPDGVVVVNGDNPYCVKEAETLGREVLFYGIEANPHLAAHAKDIRVDGAHTVFTLVLNGDGSTECRTKLLGRHNVLNIVGAALMARRMGLSFEEIQMGIREIEPVEHRLQLIDPGTGLLVIDDAFNANPDGADMALEVLGQFQGYRKWIVTPGMVELGAKADEVHFQFGQHMANVCDEVVLIGKLNTPAMLRGLREANFPESHIHVKGSLAEWMKESSQHWRPGDVVLFENDFGDHLETLK